MLTKNLILSLKQSLDSTHQSTTLTGKVGSSLLIERCLKQIARANAYAHSQSLLLCLTRCILIDSIRRVNTTSLKEQRAQRCAGTLRSNHDDIDILWRNDTRAVLPVDSETMAVVQCLAGCQTLLDCRPL